MKIRSKLFLAFFLIIGVPMILLGAGVITFTSYHMDELFSFIHTADTMNDLHKAAAIHYYFAFLHPYFDGNGRMARMLHLWYLLQQGYSASLFLPFSSIIQKTKQDYYKAFDYTEKNAHI